MYPFATPITSSAIMQKYSVIYLAKEFAIYVAYIVGQKVNKLLVFL
jgi:hypothetical protein